MISKYGSGQSRLAEHPFFNDFHDICVQTIRNRHVLFICESVCGKDVLARIRCMKEKIISVLYWLSSKLYQERSLDYGLYVKLLKDYTLHQADQTFKI